jgi:hypothetical protein
MTEGALAFACCIRTSSRVTAAGDRSDLTDLPARSFDSFAPDGRSLNPPRVGQGCCWSGWSQVGVLLPDSEPLVVHIARLFDGSLWGLVYRPQKDLRLPLEHAVWRPGANPDLASLGAWTFVFDHHRDVGATDRVTYSIPFTRRLGGGHQSLMGTRIVIAIRRTLRRDGCWPAAHRDVTSVSLSGNGAGPGSPTAFPFDAHSPSPSPGLRSKRRRFVVNSAVVPIRRLGDRPPNGITRPRLCCPASSVPAGLAVSVVSG